MKTKVAWIVLSLFLPCAAIAQNAWQYSKKIERSMVVTGVIEVNPDGSVHDYTLDQPDKLLPGIVEIVSRTIPAWKFQPLSVDKNPYLLKGKMSIRIVADKLDGDRYALSVRGVSFSDNNSTDAISLESKAPPTYPQEALNGGVSGTAYVIAMIDRIGHVEKAAAIQVDLRALGPDPVLARLRKDFARASVAAVEHWTFNVPAALREGGKDHWFVRIPINYQAVYNNVKPVEEYGRWDAYVPGPVEHIPWYESNETAHHGSQDAIPDNLAYQDDPRFVLLNPPGNG